MTATRFPLLSLPGFLRLLLVIIGLGATAAHAAETLYTCSMHPQVLQSEPGSCPICGMTLTALKTGGGSLTDLVIEIDPGTVQLMNLRTEPVARGPVNRLIRAVGEVEFNERTLRDITTKYDGWVERLHVDATWTQVSAGDPLFDIYSPELYNAQLNYLIALRSEGAAGGPLTRSALDRLRLFDVSSDFLAELAASDTPQRTYTYRAPFDGIVIDKAGVEGQMLKAGERVFRLANLDTVWVNAQLYEREVPEIAAGLEVQVRATYGGDRSFHGIIDQVLPMVQADTRTVMARTLVHNVDGFLRPGMYADVRLTLTESEDAVLVADSAVIRSGERNTVFVALDGGRFEAREIRLGSRTNDYRYEVLEGLEAGERVVVSGQFMLDSESQLREAIRKLMPDDATDADAAMEAMSDHQH